MGLEKANITSTAEINDIIFFMCAPLVIIINLTMLLNVGQRESYKFLAQFDNLFTPSTTFGAYFLIISSSISLQLVTFLKNSADLAIEVIGLEKANITSTAEINDIIFFMCTPLVIMINLTTLLKRGQRDSYKFLAQFDNLFTPSTTFGANFLIVSSSIILQFVTFLKNSIPSKSV